MVMGRTGHAPRDLKGRLHQEFRLKSEEHFRKKHSFSEKCLLFRKFRLFLYEINFVLRFPLFLNHPINQHSKELRWLVRVAMYLQGGHGPLTLHSAEAHAYSYRCRSTYTYFFSGKLFCIRHLFVLDVS